MSQRRLLVWIAVYVCSGLALFGFLMFVVTVLTEYLYGGNQGLTPTIQLGLAGLGLAALMGLIGFFLVGLLLARQTRQQGPGYGDAVRLMQNYQFASAIPLLERAIEQGRITPDLLMMLSSAYAFSGQYGKAQSSADWAVSMFPEDPDAYITLATGYRLQASYTEAARALKAATELAPRQAVLWAELGFAYLLAGDRRNAIKALEVAVQHPIPPMYAVRVYYHLMQQAQTDNNQDLTQVYHEQMVKSRAGLERWQALHEALSGTGYGQILGHEIEKVQQAIRQESTTPIPLTSLG